MYCWSEGLVSIQSHRNNILAYLSDDGLFATSSIAMGLISPLRTSDLAKHSDIQSATAHENTSPFTVAEGCSAVGSEAISLGDASAVGPMAIPDDAIDVEPFVWTGIRQMSNKVR